MKEVAIIGIDPSSRKLASISAILGQEQNYVIDTIALFPKDRPRSCAIATKWMRHLVASLHEQVDDVYVFIEAPVLGRGGARATIPQAQVGGCLLAGAYTSNAKDIVLVNNQRAKKEIVGKGNASKDEIKAWCRVVWPAVFREAGTDQDVCDSAMIYAFGAKIVSRSLALNPRSFRTPKPKR
jgi:Holliday junction resolvasome RuvABC endonuclease subunit